MPEAAPTENLPSLLTEGPSFFVKVRNDLTAVRQENGRIALFRNGVKVLDVPGIPLFEGLIQNWMTEALIDPLAGSAENLPVVYFLLEKLFSLGLLQAQCRVAGKSLFSFQPAPHLQAWRETLPASWRKLSPSACLRRVGDSFVLEMPLSQRECILHDEKCLVWLMEMARKGVSLPVDDEARRAFYLALWLMKALDEEKPAQPIWEFHDLLFFHASSIGFHDDPAGATWQLRGHVPPAPLFKPCKGECLSLPEPDKELRELLYAPFAEVLAYRLILQDLGCLYQTLNLTATALGLASCILGTVDSRRLGKILGLEPLEEPVIGEMTLSSKPDTGYTNLHSEGEQSVRK